MDGIRLNISNDFNRFYHGVVLSQALKQCRQIKFNLWIDDETGGVFTFYKYEHYSDLDDLKELFKNMNIDYPIAGDDKLSTTKITSKELSRHIEWAIKTVGENEVELDFIREKWDRLLEQAGIEKEK